MSAAPDFLEPFESWRVWRVVRSDGEYVLGSVVQPTVWPPRRALVAECLARRLWRPFRRGRDHGAPDFGCRCGIYAATLDRACEYLDAFRADAAVRVLGRVSLWGTVVECDRGFRASHAYPARIFVPADTGARRVRWDELVVALSRYGVPVEPLPETTAGAIRKLAERIPG